MVTSNKIYYILLIATAVNFLCAEENNHNKIFEKLKGVKFTGSILQTNNTFNSELENWNLHQDKGFSVGIEIDILKYLTFGLSLSKRYYEINYDFTYEDKINIFDDVDNVSINLNENFIVNSDFLVGRISVKKDIIKPFSMHIGIEGTYFINGHFDGMGYLTIDYEEYDYYDYYGSVTDGGVFTNYFVPNKFQYGFIGGIEMKISKIFRLRGLYYKGMTNNLYKYGKYHEVDGWDAFDPNFGSNNELIPKEQNFKQSYLQFQLIVNLW